MATAKGRILGLPPVPAGTPPALATFLRRIEENFRVLDGRTSERPVIREVGGAGVVATPDDDEDDMAGLGSIELTIFLKRDRDDPNPPVPLLEGPNRAMFDIDGEPETPGFLGRLTNIGDWSRAFPEYDAATEVVLCTQNVGTTDGGIVGEWSAIRICESPSDLNTVFVRSQGAPTALMPGTERVPTGTFDMVPTEGTDPVWANTGHRNALSDVWTWFGWVRIEGLDGEAALAGTSSVELTIYQKVTMGAADPALPALDGTEAMFDFNGIPETDGFTGRLTGIGSWSRAFPTFNVQTEVVLCSQTVGTSNDEFAGAWSAIRICESPSDLNTVFIRSTTMPAALAAGTDRVPSGTSDTVPTTGTDPVWTNTGHRNALSSTWTWFGWVRAEGLDGTNGLRGPVALEATIYQKRTKGAADPDLPALTGDTPATYDYDGSPESTGFVGLLSGIGSWSRAFPSYNAQTEEVVCSQIVVTSEDAFVGSWTAIRVCENPSDLNTVFVRSTTTPTALVAGTMRVPTDTTDDVPAGTDPVWSNTGHRNALSNTWTWFGWVRTEGLDGVRGPRGLTAVELTIYQKRTKGAADPDVPDLTGDSPATFDYDGSPESTGFIGLLEGIGSWSRAFPAYAPATEEVVCVQITAKSDDTFEGSWSAIRVCENPSDLNTVYIRNATEPAALADGTMRVPSGTSDSVPTSGTDPVWSNTGHKDALSNTWTWFGWLRAEGLDGVNGDDGTNVLTGTGAPGSALGNNGDSYIDNATGEIWKKADDAWAKTGHSFKGADGATWLPPVSTTPDPATGNVNDYILQTGDPVRIFRKTDATTWTELLTISDGDTGNTWFSGTEPPLPGLGNDLDFYLETDTGLVYKKIDGTWFEQLDITGPQGPPGDVSRFLRPVVEIAVQAEGPSISQADSFAPDPATERLTFIPDEGESIFVGVSGDISRNGVTVTLVGSDADLFELVPEDD